MNKGTSSKSKDRRFVKKNIVFFTVFLISADGFAQTYEHLVFRGLAHWDHFSIDNTTTPNGAILAEDGASVTLNDVDITVGLISGAGITTYRSKLTAEDLTINVKDSGGEAVGIRIDPSSQVNLVNMKLTNHGEGQGIKFNVYRTAENTESVLNIRDSSIETTNGKGIDAMGTVLTLTNVDILARGDFAHALDMNTGARDATIIGGSLTTEGYESYGIWMIDDGARMDSLGTRFHTSGIRSHGLTLQRSRHDVFVPLSSAILLDTAFTTTGDRAYGIYAEGKVAGRGISVDTSGVNAHGMAAIGDGVIDIQESTINTHNRLAYGMVATKGSKIKGQALTINTEGENAHGLYSEEGQLTIDDSQISVTGNKSAGIFIASDSTTNNFLYNELIKLSPSAVLNNTSVFSQNAFGILSVEGPSVVKLINSTIATENGYALAALTTLDTFQNPFPAALYLDAVDSTISGDIIATDESKIYADLKGKRGVLTGQLTHVELVNLQESRWNITGTSQLTTLNNDGSIVFEQGNTDHQLIIDGDYSGKGSLAVSGILSDDNSPINKVIIKGDVLADSDTSVSVNNLGGVGAETIEGIKLISVGGASHGIFTQQGRIVAGAYEYSLVKKAESWYLSSAQPKPEPDPKPDPDPKPEPEPGPTPRPAPTIRVEVGSYLANFIAGNTLFNTSLFERESDPFDHELSYLGQNTSTLWLRQAGGRSGWSDSSGQLATKSNRYVAQLGGALLQLETPAGGRWSTGIMAGYGHHHNSTTSHRVAYRAKGNVNGYSTGLYSTWINEGTGKGGYIDSWLLYNWFNNSVKGDELRPQYYRSKGISGSIETGYISEVLRFNGSLGSEYRWYFMPSAQLIYQGVKNRDIIEDNKTRVSNTGKHNLQSKLGIRSWIRGRHQIDQHTERYFQPFAEVNWIHNSQRHGVKMDGAKVELAGAENMAEMKLGLEANLSQQGSIWVNTAVQVGSRGYNDNRLTLGGKWHF